MTKTTTVRIPEETRQALRVLSEQTGRSMQEILTRSIEAYRDQLLLDQANSAYSGLRRDGKAWRAEIGERKVWDKALSDGLDAE